MKHHDEELRELSAGEISAICSSLAKGCEKQRLNAEMEAFNKIADYYKSKARTESGKTFTDIADLLNRDQTESFPAANASAQAAADRGALRSLTWSKKVSAMCDVLLKRFDKEGEAMLANNKIFICDICGFVYVGNTPPELCPICKVPKHKILEVKRG
ncbi:MAG: hypothetical protein LBV09_00405 [Deferribacteraceae bacterium]|nr:hypothetical protein [Deferribacteraceae bacterium]